MIDARVLRLKPLGSIREGAQMTCTALRLSCAGLVLALAFLLARDFARDHAQAFEICERAHSRATCQHIMR